MRHYRFAALTAIIALKATARVEESEEIAVTVVMAGIAMYTSGMPGQPEVPDEIPVNEARNKLGPIIAKSRYLSGATFLMNRGKRVAAVVPVEVGELVEDFGDTELLVTIVRDIIATRNDPEEADEGR